MRRKTIKHHKKRNKKNNTKRGGEGTPTQEAKKPVPFYNPTTLKQNITNSTFFNPTEVQDRILSKKQSEQEQSEQKQSEQKHNEQNEKRLLATKEFEELSKKYDATKKRERERIAVRDSFKNPVTAEVFFSETNNNLPNNTDECDNGRCTIMGGRKTRKHKNHTITKKRRRKRR